jgi:hypothetical protein
MRIKPQREFYIPAQACRVADKLSSAVAYLATNAAGKPVAIVFQGRRQKPDWHYRFANAAAREARVRSFFELVRANEGARERRRSEPHKLTVGDVLRSSWGYDQTNVDFYQVTALIGSTMVEIRELAQDVEATDSMRGRCVPVPGRFIGEPMKKRAQGESVKIESYAYAYKIEPTEPAPGVRVYESSYFSSDH